MSDILLPGDVSLMSVTDQQVPFRNARDRFSKADIVFSNFETCLYRPPSGHSVGNEGFHADPHIGGESQRYAGIDAVGIANNVNYGDAAILSSVAKLDELGISHAGAGANLAAARRPDIVKKVRSHWKQAGGQGRSCRSRFAARRLTSVNIRLTHCRHGTNKIVGKERQHEST